MLQQFINEISNSQTVYTLKNNESIASVESQYEDDDNGVPIEAMCIWSKKRYAESNIDEEWTEYELTEISVSSFLEDWCVGLFNDGLVFCMNINSEEQEPMEYEPLDLAYEIANHFIKNDIAIKLTNYKEINDFILAIKPFIITRPDNDKD